MKTPQKNWLEWTVFAISAVLVLATIAYLVVDGATLGDEPPRLSVTLGEPVARDDQFFVPVTVENTGDETAENVHVVVELRDGETILDEGEFDMAFIPRKSSGSGWVILAEDPAQGDLAGRATGFELP